MSTYRVTFLYSMTIDVEAPNAEDAEDKAYEGFSVAELEFASVETQEISERE